MATTQQLTRDQVTALAQHAGFSGQALDIAVAIAYAESRFYVNATHTNTDGSTDYGLWQINTINHYDPARLITEPAYNAAAAYAIYRSWGNFKAWTTFNSNAYLAYMSPSTPNVPTQQVKSATSNAYPKGQCTWWASERYHKLAGYYVPWMANAKDWVSGAQSNGWQVSDKPVIPSIIVLQAGVQGADTTFGHVAIAESVNRNGTVHASTQNWNNITYPDTTYWDFKPGPGVSFVYAGSGTTSGTGEEFNVGGDIGAQPTFTPFLKQIHNTLTDTPGFYGMALALDEAEQFSGWVDLTDHGANNNNLLGWLTGTQFDFIGFTRSVGATVSDNLVPFTIRSNLVALGLILLIFLFLKVVLSVAEGGLTIAKDVAPLAAAAL